MRHLVLLGTLLAIAIIATIVENAVGTVAMAQPAPPRPTLPAPERPPYTPEPPTPTASPTPTAAPTSTPRPAVGPDELCLRLADVNRVTATESRISYVLTLQNFSVSTTLRNATVIISLPQTTHTVVDVRTSKRSFWTSAVTEQTLTLSLTEAQPGEVLTATINLLPSKPRNTPAVTTRASISWISAGRSQTTQSNAVVVEDGWQASKLIAPTVQLTYDSVQQGWTMTGVEFNPFETISIWALTDRGENVALTSVKALTDGRFSVFLAANRLPPDLFRFTAQGVCSSTPSSVEAVIP